MIGSLFFVILRSVGIPIAAIYLLQNSFLGEQGAWIAVIVTLAIINFISIVFQLIKILPNTLLLRGKRVIILITQIVIEIVSVIGFTIMYFNRFGS